MPGPDVDAVRFYLQTYPDLAEYVRFDPLKVRSNNRWLRVKEVRVMQRGLELRCRTGISVRLFPSDARQAQRREQIKLLTELIRESIGNGKVTKLLTETDRNLHQTGAFLRGIVEVRGVRHAVIAVFEGESYELSTRLVSSLVLWWNRIVSRGCSRLVVLVPESWGRRVVGYFPDLRIPLECFQFSFRETTLRQIYPSEPESTQVSPPYVFYPLVAEVPELLCLTKAEYPSLDLLFRQDRWELSYLGLPLLWTDQAGHCYFDFRSPKDPQKTGRGALEKHIEYVIEVRRFPPASRENYYYQFGQERWLESLLIRNMRKINPDCSAPVYCQVPTWLEGERRVLDLLTATVQGRLMVVELKIEKDLNLIFQGFDYWDRVGYHLERGDFHRAGYFPGTELCHEAPLLYLVSPLFEFHRVLPVFRRYLNREIRFECLGINYDWRRNLKIVRRFRF